MEFAPQPFMTQNSREDTTVLNHSRWKATTCISTATGANNSDITLARTSYEFAWQQIRDKHATSYTNRNDCVSLVIPPLRRLRYVLIIFIHQHQRQQKNKQYI